MAGNKNSGRRARPKKAVPVIVIELPKGAVEKPIRLSKGASEVWDDLAPIAITMGTLTPADVAAFASLCELESSRWLIAQAKDSETFLPMRTGKDYKGNTVTIEDPALAAERESIVALKPLLLRFGLDPTGLGRVIRVPQSAATPATPGAAPAASPKSDVRDFAKRARARLKLAKHG